LNFYQGRVLRVDLTAGSVEIEPLNMEWARMYVGGKGLLFRYMLEEIPAGLDPWSPDNPLIVATGPMAGTTVSTGSRVAIGGKSPATGTVLDSYVGGSFGSELKFAGYDMLIVTGRAAKPSAIFIKDDDVSIVPAERYWGMKTSEIEAALRRDVDERMTALTIGPAGENKLLWACISNDQYHKAGRGGTGALMGSKNLKAIAVRGTGCVSVGDARAFLKDVERINHDYVLTDDNLWAHEEGTPIIVDMVDAAGLCPTRNYSEGSFGGNENINSAAFQKIRVKKRACYQCALGCRNFHAVGDVRGEGPEYETIALCGANCGVDDIVALMKFNAECDEWAMDTISTGNVLGLAMDLTERGIHDFGVRFGQIDAYLKIPEQLATRTGIGAELAVGTKALAEKYGHPELGMQVKNLEVPGYDPRGAFGMSIAYATSDRGACHMRAFPVADEVYTGKERPDTLDGKALYNVEAQNHYAFKFCGIWCDFWAIDWDQMRQLMKHVWGREVAQEELEKVGERVWNLGRIFNLREGLTAKDDRVPRRFLTEPFKKGASAGWVIGEEAFAASLAEYYRLRGWDADGVPSAAKLSELGIDVPLPAR
jgi:aldehyde:ferredoxin oxidoreductase